MAKNPLDKFTEGGSTKKKASGKKAKSTDKKKATAKKAKKAGGKKKGGKTAKKKGSGGR